MAAAGPAPGRAFGTECSDPGHSVPNARPGVGPAAAITSQIWKYCGHTAHVHSPRPQPTSTAHVHSPQRGKVEFV